jgi:hypothetical protein
MLICHGRRVAPRGSDVMKDEYDFSKAERCKFYRPDAVWAPPRHWRSQGASDCGLKPLIFIGSRSHVGH